MKRFKITKGSEASFFEAPEWALMLVNTKYQVPRFYEGFNIGDRYVSVGETSPFGQIPPPGLPPISESEVIAIREPINEPVWDGEGLPPVGVEFEYGTHRSKAKCIAVSLQYVFASKGNPDDQESDFEEFLISIADSEFHPVRTESDKNREIIIKQLLEILSVGSDIKGDADNIYNAISSGLITGVKLDDDI